MSKEQQLGSRAEDKKVGFLLGLGIFFLPWVFSWFTLKKGYSSTAKTVAFIWMVLYVGAGFNQQSEESTSNSVSKIDPEKVEYINESCLEVSQKFGTDSSLSDIQKQESWKDYKGKAFEWDMEVGEVQDEAFGSGYNVQFKCRGSNAFITDVMIDYPQSNKQEVLQLQKGNFYNVKGVLNDYSGFVGLTADPL